MYETSVDDPAALCQSLKGRAVHEIVERVSLADQPGLDAVLQCAAEGQGLAIVSPGVDEDMRVCLGVLS